MDAYPKMKKKELKNKVYDLEDRIGYLERTVKVLRDNLQKADVLYTHPSMCLTLGPISLRDMKDQIDAMKNFLGVEFTVEPEIPAKGMMKKKAKDK